MNDELTPTDAIAPSSASLDHPTPLPSGPTAPAAPAVSFTGRTPGRTNAIRAGMVLGTGLLVAIGAAVVMGASPAPSTSSGSQPQTVPGTGNGGRGFGFGGPAFGGAFGPDDAGIPGMARGRDFRGRMGFADITISGISGSSISVRTDDGWTRTIAVTSGTTITKGGASATLADLAVGDSVRFAETRNSDGTYTITALEIVLPRTAGTVTAVGSDTITITLRDGTSQTIRTTGSTTYRLEQAGGKRSDVTVGARIAATGTKAADGTLTATTVVIDLPHVIGKVTATTGSTITVTRADGTTLTIHVGSSTTLQVAGVDKATIADIKVGMVVAAEGTQRSDGSIDATDVHAGAMGFGKGRGGPWADAHPGASAAPSSTGTTG